jgi:threonine dehydrogenase-like Zn-dependent dehydrogenase
LGALLVQLASRAGAEVIAISRRDWALDLAEQCGARHRIRMDAPQRVQEQVRCIAGDNGCPRVIEAVGNQTALDVAGELVGTRGKLIVAGFHQDGLRLVNMQSWNWRGIDVINAHERDPRVYVCGMREALDLVAAGELDPRPLMTHCFPLSELPRALEMCVQRPAGFLKAIVDCNHSTTSHKRRLNAAAKSQR